MKFQMSSQLFTLLVLLSLLIHTHSMDGQSLLSDKRQYKNEIAINIRNFSWDNKFSSLGLMYKRSYRRGKLIDVNSIKAMRFFIGSLTSQIELTHDPTIDSLQFVDGRTSIVNTNTNNVFKAYNDINISVGFGLEKQMVINNVIAYYGGDLILGYADIEDDGANAYFDGVLFNHTSTTDVRWRSYEVGLNPFVGFKYYLTSRMSLSAEVGVYLRYFESAELWYGGGPQTHSRGIITRYQGIRNVNVNYIF